MKIALAALLCALLASTAQAQVASNLVATTPSGGGTFIDITPYSTPANSDFIFHQMGFANSGDLLRPDEVMTFGYNMNAAGGCVVATDNCLGWVVESHYQPGAQPAQMEQYAQMRTPGFGDARPFAFSLRIATGGLTEEQDFNSLNWCAPYGGGCFMTANSSVISFLIPINTPAISATSVQSTANVTAQDHFVASSTIKGYYYSARLSGPALVMNAPVGGSDYGQVVNIDAHTWGLAAGPSQTVNGTVALAWTDTGGLLVGGTPAVSCSGPPTAAFAVINGLVTHC